MKPLLRVIAFSIGCVSSPDTPTTYERGTYPVAPPVRPGHGAPVVGQPGHVRPGIQVEPNPRLPGLPHTPQTRREDTIWAAKNPQAIADVEGFYPEFEPPPVSGPVTREFVARCQTSMRLAVALARKEATLDVLDALSTENARCVNAQLYHHCALTNWEEYRAISAHVADVADATFENTLARILDHATHVMNRDCRGALLNKYVRKAVKNVKHNFDALAEGRENYDYK